VSITTAAGDTTVTVTLADCIADATNAVNVQLDTSTEFIIFDPSGATYRQTTEERRTVDSVVAGDSNGYIYQFSQDSTSYAGTAISAVHYSPEFDGGQPAMYKLWPGIRITAKGSSVTVSYELDGGSWTAFAAQTLTADYADYEFFIHRAAKKIQFKFSGTQDFQISQGVIMEPHLEGNR
jgi:hypothetical protein